LTTEALEAHDSAKQGSARILSEGIKGHSGANVDGPPTRLCGSGEKVMSRKTGRRTKAISVHSATMLQSPELKEDYSKSKLQVSYRHDQGRWINSHLE
jgi:hypothetical protein